MGQTPAPATPIAAPIQETRLGKLLDQAGTVWRREREQLRGCGFEHPLGGILAQHVELSRICPANVDQRVQEPAQQLFQILSLQLNAEQLVERLRLRLADLVIGVVERQDDAKVELLANPLEIGVLRHGLIPGDQHFEGRRQH
jgi:hypothetical protein